MKRKKKLDGNYTQILFTVFNNSSWLAQSARAVENTDSISAEG